MSVYGAYVPPSRLALATIAGRSAPEDGPERSVAWNDEDSVTMGVAAAIACRAGFDRDSVDAVLFASTTYPFREKQGASLIARALDLRRDIQFETRVIGASYDEARNRWEVKTDQGDCVSAQFLISAVGCLSAANIPKIDGIESFTGEHYHTGAWPHEGVDFTGKRVGLIGTGSTGIQATPVIAAEAEQLTVFQRTANFSVPARDVPLTPEDSREIKANYAEIRRLSREPFGGFPYAGVERSALEVSDEERTEIYERLWLDGGFKFMWASFSDILATQEANDTAADFIRDKIRGIVRDKETADKLMPDHFVMTKRPILDNGYFETFNRDNVTLVDLREDPIERFTPTSVVTRTGEHPIDMLVLATGYDAISGSMLRLNPKGRGGLSLKERWQDRFHNYLGLTIGGFPNLFMIHGPGSPGVFYNMPLGAERQLDWIGNFMRHLHERSIGAVEPTTDSEEAWANEVSTLANFTLFPRTDSWWTGANIPGKPRYFSVYLGGSIYYQRISDMADKGYEGFVFEQAPRADDAEGS